MQCHPLPAAQSHPGPFPRGFVPYAHVPKPPQKPLRPAIKPYTPAYSTGIARHGATPARDSRGNDGSEEDAAKGSSTVRIPADRLRAPRSKPTEHRVPDTTHLAPESWPPIAVAPRPPLPTRKHRTHHHHESAKREPPPIWVPNPAAPPPLQHAMSQPVLGEPHQSHYVQPQVVWVPTLVPAPPVSFAPASTMHFALPPRTVTVVHMVSCSTFTPSVASIYPPNETGRSSAEAKVISSRKARSLLNKIAPSNFDSISDQIIAIANSSEDDDDGRTLILFFRQITEAAATQPMRCELYARLCRTVLSRVSPTLHAAGLENADGKPIVEGALWRKFLLTVSTRPSSMAGLREDRQVYVRLKTNARGLAL
ncbi:hypothetical protein B0H15DRAFT_931200 [Mycena belliarum]|uniref:MIF4G domain-containing protein n=1 Tax=Mycena belliarum TaxID=1033014 RepID=A0AAD6U2V1_9AGAR|nr:hypothetical protein B0H15DRAFT_931200 [Mycena belliae]